MSNLIAELEYWTRRAQFASAFGYRTKEAYARRKVRQLLAQRIEARSDETPQAVQPEGREPGPKDAPESSSGSGVVEEG